MAPHYPALITIPFPPILISPSYTHFPAYSTFFSSIMRGVGAAQRVFELLDRPPVIPPDVPGAPKHPRAAEILKAIGGPVDPATLPPAAPVRFEGVRFEVSGCILYRSGRLRKL